MGAPLAHGYAFGIPFRTHLTSGPCCILTRGPQILSAALIIDEGLKWKDQYKSLTGKLAGGLSSLKKLKDVLPQSKLCDVYHALFESHIL